MLTARTPKIQEMPSIGRSTATAFTVSLKTEIKHIHIITFGWDDNIILFWSHHDSKHSPDCVGVSVNLVILSANPRYNSGHRYQNANVHLVVREERSHLVKLT